MTRRALALALFCSTALSCTAPAYADTTRDRMPQIYTMTPMGVNIQSGAFVHSETDFTIGSLSFVRAWRSVPSAQTGTAPATDHHRFGAWNHNYGFAARWHPGSNDGVDILADGKEYQFRWSHSTSSWEPWNIDQHNNNAFGTRLTGTVGNNLVFRNKDGVIYTFNAANQATSVEYPDGTRLSLLYDGSSRLDTVISNRGDAIVLDYNANGMIATACGYNRALVFVDLGRTCSNATPHVKVSYAYAATGGGPSAQQWNLTSVTGADNFVTQMTYDTYYRPNLLCVTLPGASPSPTGCRVTNVYGPSAQNQNYLPDQVRQQTTATGELWQYEYQNMVQYGDWPPPQFGDPPRLTEGHVTDPLGRTTRAFYENGFLRNLYAPEGRTQYSWGGLNPTHFTPPGGNTEILGYDYRNNLYLRERQAAPGSGDATITTRTVFPGHVDFTTVVCTEPDYRICNKPLFTIDERGNQTDFTHSSAHGGVLTVTRPAPTTGAVRPETRYTYSQIFAGVMNSAGTGIVPESTGVWVLTQESECRTQSSCSGGTDEVRTVYEYGPSGSANALRLRGRTVTDNAAVHRTCFTYDAVGNRISETGPGAQLASCPAQ